MCTLAVFTRLQNPTTLQALIENAKEWSKSMDKYIQPAVLCYSISVCMYCRCTHPYVYEIEHFQPTTAQLTLKDPTVSTSSILNDIDCCQVPGSLGDTPLLMVDSLNELQDMVATISSVSEIAVDLEVCDMCII